MRINYIRILKYLARAFAVFILFMAFLQFQDGYSAYGAISVALGGVSLYLSRNK
jgi:hypothetical protein